MSARQPPTPLPPSKTLLSSSQTRDRPGIKSINNSTPHIRKHSEQSPLKDHSSGCRSHPAAKAPSKPSSSSLLYVSISEPPAYWCGRLCALLDRYRNDELAVHLSKSSQTPKVQTDKMHTPEAAAARVAKAFEKLHSYCTTMEAIDSLTLFQCQYADLMKMPELRKLVPILLGSSGKENIRDEDEGGIVLGMSESRKISFVDRLLGRQRRKSVVVV